MKIKPIIKTHWLASQNPMAVPLEGLQKVVFQAPRRVLDFDFNREETSSPREIVDLPSRSEIKKAILSEAEIMDLRSRSHLFSRDLFWTLFSGVDLPILRTPPALLRELAQSIEFHFEDGDIQSLVGVFNRPGLPKFLNPHYYLTDRSCNWEKALNSPADDLMKMLKIFGHQKKNDDYIKTWFVVLEILAWSFQRQRQVGDLEVYWAEDQNDALASRQGYLMKDVEFVRARPVAATLMSDRSINDVARFRIWQGKELDGPEGVLRIRNVGVLAELESQWEPANIPEPKEEEDLSQRFPAVKWEARFEHLDRGAKDIARRISQIESLIGKDKLVIQGHRFLGPSSIQPTVRIKESEGSIMMAVHLDIESMKLRHHNFPSALSSMFKCFGGGLDHYFQIDRKEVASHQLQFRANDLLFLRHHGVVIFTLMEMLNWILGLSLSSGEEIEHIEDRDLPEADQQFEKMLNYLKSSLTGLLGKSGHSFDKLFSAEVRGYYLDFVERLYNDLRDDRSFIFRESQVGELRDIQSRIFPMLRFMLLHFVEASQGKVLTKSQAPLGERFLSSLSFWTEPRVLPFERKDEESLTFWVDLGTYNHRYLISLLFDLCDQNVKVELNGQPFESLENPFEFLLSVGDSEVQDAQNWFDLHPQIFFNGKRVSGDEVTINLGQDHIGYIEYRGQFYRINKKQLPSLKALQRFWKRVKGEKTTSKHNTFFDKVYRLEKSQALELLMLKTQGIEVRVEGEWQRIFHYFETGLGVEKVLVPDSMFKNLLPHQREGVQWLHDLYELRLGAILADEMGLGKTFQVLSFLESLRLRNELKKCLIVVPTSLVYNWIDEKKKFAPDLPIKVFNSADKENLQKELDSDDPVILVATYGLLTENTEFFERRSWNVLAFDEAQNLKNITSLRSVAARKIKAQFKICLTGTPMENNYLEFFSLCDLVVPGCLGDITAFRKEYVNREVRPDSLKDLKLISKPLVLRRTKQQVKLSLPVKLTQNVLLPFTAQQKEIYKRMAMTFSRQVDQLIQVQGEKRAQIAMFSALMRLRQICSDPSAVPGVVYHEQPAKVEHFLSSLQEHLENDESVIVFTQFLSTLGRIENELKKKQIPHFVLQGRVSAKERLRIISEFQNLSKPAVMLMTLKTGGVGLNLTKASVVYHLEPWWNPAVENQATDRAHRMGQTKDVKVYNLLIEGSLEERITDLKIKKQGSFDRLFGVDEELDESIFEANGGLTREDFIYLLK